jgi:pimeloyl-ACP methyl ester carboxylesterase
MPITRSNTAFTTCSICSRLGRDRAIWIGHDWGSPVVWSLASHYPERCQAVANLCVPYIASGIEPANFIPLVDREIYPESTYPAGLKSHPLLRCVSYFTGCLDRSRQRS